MEVSAQLVSQDGETTRREDNSKSDYLAISVQDTGIGIPEDKLDSIFASFEQADGKNNPYGGWKAEAAIDGDTKGSTWGWAVMPQAGKVNGCAREQYSLLQRLNGYGISTPPS